MTSNLKKIMNTALMASFFIVCLFIISCDKKDTGNEQEMQNDFKVENVDEEEITQEEIDKENDKIKAAVFVEDNSNIKNANYANELNDYITAEDYG